MDDSDARRRDLEQQLFQLDMEARGSALTPGEAENNRDQRDALAAELRALGDNASGSTSPAEDHGRAGRLRPAG